MVDLAAAGEPWAASLATGFQFGDGAPDRAKWEASARQPLRVEGDWESVLASPEVEVRPFANPPLLVIACDVGVNF